MDRRVAVVTGAASGIGRGIALWFAKKGLAVLIADIDRERGRTVEDEIRAENGLALFQETDVREEKSIETLMNRAIHEYSRIDVLCNNAGIERYKLAHEYTADDWQVIVDTNLRGAFLCSKYAIPELRRTKGTIINIASVQALACEMKISIYAATKAGLLALTRATALDSAKDGIRVNAICPGAIRTAMLEESLGPPTERASVLETISSAIPLGRVGTAQEVAAMAYFLVSDEASYITGATFVVDGGLLAKLAL